MDLGTLWLIFSFSFVVALSGAMAPGPLLTYTIVKTIETRRRGFLVGVWVIGGHAALESVLIVALLLGLAPFLKQPLTIRIIGIAGGLVLVSMGVSLILNVLRGKVSDVLSGDRASPRKQGTGPTMPNPFLGGIVISMSNPFWWVWWASIGFAFMLQYDISFATWPLLLAFFLGHEMGDLIWYALVSVLVYLGRRRIGNRIYQAILAICGTVMIGFGVYLGVTAYLRQ